MSALLNDSVQTIQVRKHVDKLLKQFSMIFDKEFWMRVFGFLSVPEPNCVKQKNVMQNSEKELSLKNHRL